MPVCVPKFVKAASSVIVPIFPSLQAANRSSQLPVVEGQASVLVGPTAMVLLLPFVGVADAASSGDGSVPENAATTMPLLLVFGLVQVIVPPEFSVLVV